MRIIKLALLGNLRIKQLLKFKRYLALAVLQKHNLGIYKNTI